jgi:hypothetical protein
MIIINFRFLFFIFSFLSIISRSQNAITLSSRIHLLPFIQCSRDDSLEIIAKRIHSLIRVREYYEKTYLSKNLVFIPITSVGYGDRTFYRLNDIKKITTKNSFKENAIKNYRKSKRNLKKSIRKENRSIIKDNFSLFFKIARHPETQDALSKLEKFANYEIIFLTDSLFIDVDEADPRENRINKSLKNYFDQVLLGRPENVEGFVNSINYNDSNDRLKTPDFVEDLVKENLRVAIELVTTKGLKDSLKNVTITTTDYPGADKLWINTDISENKIYLSPYLLRALFNISYYQVTLFSLAESKAKSLNSIRGFIHGKTKASAKQIDSAYYNNFVEIFSRNIQFVLGHELAHIYLKELNGQRLEKQCDCFAANFLIETFEFLELGVFETLLVNSIESKDTKYWGKLIDEKSLEERYKILVPFAKIKSPNKLDCH